MSNNIDYNIYAYSDCLPLNSTLYTTNTSSTSPGTYVQVTCIPGYQLVALTVQGQTPNVFQCKNEIWFPSSPRCLVLTGSSVPTGVIIGCTVGAAVCLAIILVAAYILYRSRGEAKLEKQQDQLQKNKIMHIDFFMSSFQRDAVGMPAVLPDALDADLRGVNGVYGAPPIEPPEDHNYDTGTNLSRSSSHHGSMESITSAGEMEANARDTF